VYSKWFSDPDPAYGELVTRLYDRGTGEALYRTYCAQLSRANDAGHPGEPLWGQRLEWQGVAMYRGDEVIAHAVVQVVKDRPLVYVGYIESVAEQDVARGLVEAVRDTLRTEQRGWTLYLPVNLSIWHSYRFKTWGDEPLPFETPCRPYYGKLFGDLFEQRERYSSYRIPLRAPETLRTANRPFHIRQVSLSNLMGDLRALYELSGAIFESEHSNPSFEEFAALYRSMLGSPGGPGIDPRLVLIAEGEGRPVGFIFAVSQGKAAYIKTFGVVRDYRRWGVARQLYDTVCFEARQMGCDSLYGLMIRDDRPLRLMLPGGTIRVAGYTLFKERMS
jgi:GNAT superfamily N-acetyltransferase